jgi:pSer/pThr/pTyr-binding forkhead associated (FHA) protein
LTLDFPRPDGRSTLNRFRLRFLLQEIDLPQGDTLIGRSASCQVTLDDPLVSREHARIRIQGGAAFVDDLGSRNGVHLSGQPIARSAELRNGDRLRIGTQELVFLELPATAEPPSRGVTRATGFMCHCASCARPYPAELVACPTCGGRDRVEEDTLTGGDQKDWRLELAAEAVERASSSASPEDWERVLATARIGLEQRLAEGREVERSLVDRVGVVAGQVAASRGEAAWGRWALSIYASLGWFPPVELSRWLERLPEAERRLLLPAAERVWDSATARKDRVDATLQAALSQLLEGSRS